MGPKKEVIVTPTAGTEYEYKIIETEPRWLTAQAVGETEPQAQAEMNKLGKEGWVYAGIIASGPHFVYLSFVRAVA